MPAGLDEGLFATAVGDHEFRACADGHEVLGQLARIRLRRAAEVDHVGIGAFHLGHERAVIRGFRVDALVADDGDTEFDAGALEHIGDAFAVEFAVVEDEDLLDAEFLGPLRGDFALNIVGGYDTEEIDFAGGTVDLRFVGFAHAGLREAWVGIRGADHHEGSLVENRHRDFRGARVVRTDVGHDVGIFHGFLRVLRLDGGIPLAALG